MKLAVNRQDRVSLQEGSDRALNGNVAIVTGVASGIREQCAARSRIQALRPSSSATDAQCN